MKIITIILLGIIFLAGCDNSPDEIVNASVINSQITDLEISENDLLPLPKRSALWMDSLFTMSSEIDGTVGGRMILEKYYISEDGDSISIKADLTIPEGAYQGVITITMTVDDHVAFVHFYPEMVFEKELKFSQSFKGLNLENYESGKIDFCYLAPDGTIELIKKDGVEIKIKDGQVKVSKAKLPHFSRYGWIRKGDGGG